MKDKKVPTACIQTQYPQTYCGRSPNSDEFMFKDANRAAEIYASSNVIKACEDCVKRFKESEGPGITSVSNFIRGIGSQR